MALDQADCGAGRLNLTVYRCCLRIQVLNVQVPFFFKDIVDALNVPITADSTVWVLGGAAISGCKRLRISFVLHRG